MAPSGYSFAATKSLSPSTGVPYHFLPPSTLMNNPSFVAAYQAFSVICSERTRGAMAMGIGTSSGSFFADLAAGFFAAVAPVFLDFVATGRGAATGSGFGCHSGTGPLIITAGCHAPRSDVRKKIPWFVPAYMTPLSAC